MLQSTRTIQAHDRSEESKRAWRAPLRWPATRGSPYLSHVPGVQYLPIVERCKQHIKLCENKYKNQMLKLPKHQRNANSTFTEMEPIAMLQADGSRQGGNVYITRTPNSSLNIIEHHVVVDSRSKALNRVAHPVQAPMAQSYFSHPCILHTHTKLLR